MKTLEMIMMTFIKGHVPSSKNSRIFNSRTRRSFPSSSVQKYYKESEKDWEINKKDFLQTIKSLAYPIHIGFHFVRATKHKYDFVNPLQTIQDRLVHFGYLEDDNMDVLVPHPYEINGTYTTVDKNNPGVFIVILKV